MLWPTYQPSLAAAASFHGFPDNVEFLRKRIGAKK